MGGGLCDFTVSQSQTLDLDLDLTLDLDLGLSLDNFRKIIEALKFYGFYVR